MKAQFRHAQGFSLVELLVVIAILGILAAIAIPMYGDYRVRSNRTEGKAALLTAAQQVERFFTNNNTYVAAPIPAASEHGLYNLSLAATTTTYTLSADPVASQAQDTACDPLSVNQAGLKLPAACW